MDLRTIMRSNELSIQRLSRIGYLRNIDMGPRREDMDMIHHGYGTEQILKNKMWGHGFMIHLFFVHRSIYNIHQSP